MMMNFDPFVTDSMLADRLIADMAYITGSKQCP